MRTAIIIGFDYKNWKELPGIPIDIYCAFKTAMRSKPDRTIVVTDIDRDYEGITYYEAIINEVVDGDLLQFISSIQQQGYHHKFRSSQDLRDVILEYSRDCSQVFFYFTGHCKNGEMLLPMPDKVLLPMPDKVLLPTTNRELLPMPSEVTHEISHTIYGIVRQGNDSIPISDILDMITRSSLPNSDIFCICDCCESDGMKLPFILDSSADRYRLRSDLTLQELSFPKQNVICISSSSFNQEAKSNRMGSLFTPRFCQVISKCRSLFTSREQVQAMVESMSSQTITVHSSKPTSKLTPSWIHGHSLDIEFLPIERAHKIRRWN